MNYLLNGRSDLHRPLTRALAPGCVRFNNNPTEVKGQGKNANNHIFFFYRIGVPHTIFIYRPISLKHVPKRVGYHNNLQQPAIEQSSHTLSRKFTVDACFRHILE